MRRGLVAGVAGAVAVGVAAGVTGERYLVGRARLRPDPEADQPFFGLPADRTCAVTADDGVRLHVEEVGPVDAPLTVVFCHGYTQEMAVWHYQRIALADDRRVRAVYWDQRSHGRSGRSSAEHSTIDWLGRDLAAVLSARAPSGPVVLVGHSMGGMTIMALADQHPQLFADRRDGRVVGVMLIGTSTGKLAEVTFGVPAAVGAVTRRVVPWLTRGMQRRPGVFERGRRLGTDLAFLIARHEGFGSTDVSPALVEFVEKMTANTRVDVIAEFYDTFTTHDKLAALDVLRGVPTVVLVGSRDRITPRDHSQVIADALPDAHFVEVDGAGHMVQLEQPEQVTSALRALLRRAGVAASA